MPLHLSKSFIVLLFVANAVFLSNLITLYLPFSPLLTQNPHSKTLGQPLLRLNSKNEFSIAIFADLHYGEDEDGFGIAQDIASARVMNRILDLEKPDFVVINGDLITGENTFLENSTAYLDVLVQPLVSHNTPWASTYGNHDTQFNLSRELLFSAEKRYNLSYTQHSPPGVPGVTNYYIPIYSKQNSNSADNIESKDEAPVLILYFFDSQGGSPFQTKGAIPNWVLPPVSSWFLSTHNFLVHKYRKEIPSLAFVHIPPTPFLRFQCEILPGIGDKSKFFPGLNDDVPVDVQGTGWNGDSDRVFVHALREVGVHSIYVGHDHGDSWCATWNDNRVINSEDKVIGEIGDKRKSPFLCFSKHTGYGGYGNWARGSRVSKLGFGYGGEMEVESWVRMESGSIVQKVGLNETYGADIYPSNDGEGKGSSGS